MKVYCEIHVKFNISQGLWLFLESDISTYQCRVQPVSMAEEGQPETAALEPKSLGFVAMETEPKENTCNLCISGSKLVNGRPLKTEEK